MHAMLGGIWQSIIDLFTGIFAIIPQFLYFFFTCITSLIDVLQFVLRRLAGLDYYYINGEKVTGDILSDIVYSILGINGRQSALTNVFWSLIIFGVILLVLSTIFAVIKSHYNYDKAKSNPIKIIGSAVKALGTIAIVPLVTIFGIFLANVLLKSLDQITSSADQSTVSEVYEHSSATVESTFEEFEDGWGNKTYACYDFFGFGSPTTKQTFSSIMFKIAAHGCNRVRYDSYSASEAGRYWSDVGIFNSDLGNPDEQREDVANMIDYAFANNLHLKEGGHVSVLTKLQALPLLSSYRYLQSKVWYLGTVYFKSFSKYNVGLVWYYYNLWGFDFILGFISAVLTITILTNIILGLITRLIEGTALFLILGPLVGLMPIDGGYAFKKWRSEFTGDVLLGFGAVVGLNIIFLLLPYLRTISFFEGALLNGIMDMVFVIVALITVKQLVQLMSNFIGGKDAAAEGAGVKKDMLDPAKKAAEKTASAMMVAAKVAKFIPGVSAAATAVNKALKKVKALMDKKKAQQALADASSGPIKVSEKVFDDMKQQQIEQYENDIKAQQQTVDQKEEEADQYYKAARHDSKDEREILEDLSSDQTRKEFEDYYNGVNTDLLTHAGMDATDIAAANAALSETNVDDAYKKFMKDVATHHKNDRIAPLEQPNRALMEAAMLDADAARQAIEDDEKEIAKIKQSTYTIPNVTVKKSPLRAMKRGAQALVKFSGETLKAFGGVFSFDAAVDSLNKETKTLDYGKVAIRDFAQQIGVDLSKNKRFMTSEEKEDKNKADVKAQVKSGSGMSAQQAALRNIRKLTQTIRDNYRKI